MCNLILSATEPDVKAEPVIAESETYVLLETPGEYRTESDEVYAIMAEQAAR
jgi:hypothetical protein